MMETLRGEYLELLSKRKFGDALAILASIGVDCEVIPGKIAYYYRKNEPKHMIDDLFHLMIGHKDHPNMFTDGSKTTHSFSNFYGYPDMDMDSE